MSRRIAFIGRGDFASAWAELERGGTETYQGQFATLRTFDAFTRGHPRLALSIGSRRECVDGASISIRTYARSNLPIVPGRLKEGLLARRMLRALSDFGPTHLVLRLSGQTGLRVLEWAIARRVPSALILATTLDPRRPWDRALCQCANDQSVAFAANHLRVATQSLAACGLHPDKAIDYDFPDRLVANVFPDKTLPSEPTLLYVGTLSEDKGVPEVLSAMRELRARGRPWVCTVCGDGPLAHACRTAEAEGLIRFLGRVDRARVTQLSAEATLAIMPSRLTFAEGMPLTLLEALATHTPVVASAHPVFQGYLREGEGVTFFEPGNGRSLAARIEATLESAGRYAEMSREAARAWGRVQSPTQYADLFERLRKIWHFDAP